MLGRRGAIFGHGVLRDRVVLTLEKRHNQLVAENNVSRTLLARLGLEADGAAPLLDILSSLLAFA